MNPCTCPNKKKKSSKSLIAYLLRTISDTRPPDLVLKFGFLYGFEDKKYGFLWARLITIWTFHGSHLSQSYE